MRDLASQFRRCGGLGARLACVLRYWTLYVGGRLKGLDRAQSRLEALASMAAGGALSSRVILSLGDGLHAELDVFSSAFLLREIFDDGTYRLPGFIPQEGWVVVDVGAHQGLFTLDAARRVGRGGRVVSVESFPFNRDLLERNLAANHFDRVSVAPVAAAEAKGPRTFYVTPYSTGWQSLVFQGEGRVPTQVAADTLDSILDERGIEHVDLLKVDVEGAWRLVFAGAPKLLARRPRIVMEVEGDEAEVGAAMEHLRGMGYDVERRFSVVFAQPKGA